MVQVRQRDIAVTTYTPVTKTGVIDHPPNAGGVAGAPVRRLGRKGWRGALAAAFAAGNSAVTADARGATPAMPGHGGGAAGAGLARGDRVIVSRNAYPSTARTLAYQNGRLIARDRHVVERTGRTVTSSELNQQPYSGVPNADAYPARGAYDMINRTLSWQIGTDGTRGLDNDGYHATTTAGEKAYPLGTQGDPWTRKNGGTPGLYHPYGARGVVVGPEPELVALPGDASGLPAGTLIAQGAPGDGPQKIYGGTPHGLHSATIPAAVVTQAGYRKRPQQTVGTTPMRPANSKIAGQSYNQTVVHLDGTGGGALPRVNGGRQPGINARWRGQS